MSKMVFLGFCPFCPLCETSVSGDWPVFLNWGHWPSRKVDKIKVGVKPKSRSWDITAMGHPANFVG
jgi:hypothetical protein